MNRVHIRQDQQHQSRGSSSGFADRTRSQSAGRLSHYSVSAVAQYTQQQPPQQPYPAPFVRQMSFQEKEGGSLAESSSNYMVVYTHSIAPLD